MGNSRGKKAEISWFIKNFPYFFISLTGFLFLWQVITLLLAVPEYILPSPLQILTVMQQSRSLLINHALITIQEILLGLSIGVSIGVLLAVLMSYFNALYKILYPVLIAVQGLPKLILAPLFIIWFGFGMLSKIILIALMVFFPVLITTSKGLESVQPELLDLLKSLCASKLQILKKIRLPSSIPYFFSGLKIAVPLAVVGAVFAEYLGAERGLGYIIMISSVNLDTSRMFAALFLLAIISQSIFVGVCLLERIILPLCEHE